MNDTRRSIYYAIEEYMARYGRSPSVRDLATMVHSPYFNVWKHINKLREEGYITTKRFQDRSIALTRKRMEE